MAFTARSRSAEDALDLRCSLTLPVVWNEFFYAPYYNTNKLQVQPSSFCTLSASFTFTSSSPAVPLFLQTLSSSSLSLSLPFFYDLPPFSFSNANFLLSSSVSLSLFLSQTCWSAAAVTSLATVLHSDWTLGHVARQQQ